MGRCPKPRRSAGNKSLLRFLREAAELLSVGMPKPRRSARNKSLLRFLREAAEPLFMALILLLVEITQNMHRFPIFIIPKGLSTPATDKMHGY